MNALQTRRLAGFERLEDRQMLTTTPFFEQSLSGSSGSQSTTDQYTFAFLQGDIVTVSATASVGVVNNIGTDGATPNNTADDYTSFSNVTDALNFDQSSPLVSSADTVFYYVAPTSGDYAINIDVSSNTNYTATIRGYRSVLDDQLASEEPELFLDFDGTEDPSVVPFATPLNTLSTTLGRTAEDENLLNVDLTIDRIVAEVERIFEDYPSLIITNSRDDGDRFDPINMPHVARVVIGDIPGSSHGNSFGLDFGNLVVADDGTVDFGTVADDISSFELGPQQPISGASNDLIMDVIARAVGRIATHEFGHNLGLYHTQNTSVAAEDIMSVNQPGFSLSEIAAGVGDNGYVDLPGVQGFDDITNSRFLISDHLLGTSTPFIGKQNAPAIVEAGLGGFNIAPRVNSVELIYENNPSGAIHSYDYSERDPGNVEEFLRVGDESQLLTAQVPEIDEIKIGFRELVNEDAALDTAFTLINLQTGVTITSTANDVTFDVPTKTATWDVGTVAAKGQYILKVDDGITDLSGLALDGEWTNPGTLFPTAGQTIQSSVFPSGDGTPGGDFEFVFTLLPGDTGLIGAAGNENNELNVVNGLDSSVLSSNFNQSVSGGFSDGDFNLDGVVDGLDFSILSSNFNDIFRLQSVVADVNRDGSIDDDGATIADDDLLAIADSTAGYDRDVDRDGNVDIEDWQLLQSLVNLDLAIELEYGS